MIRKRVRMLHTYFSHEVFMISNSECIRRSWWIDEYNIYYPSPDKDGKNEEKLDTEDDKRDKGEKWPKKYPPSDFEYLLPKEVVTPGQSPVDMVPDAAGRYVFQKDRDYHIQCLICQKWYFRLWHNRSDRDPNKSSTYTMLTMAIKCAKRHAGMITTQHLPQKFSISFYALKIIFGWGEDH